MRGHVVVFHQKPKEVKALNSIGLVSKVTKDLKTVKEGDSVQFRPMAGGPARLMKVIKIGIPKSGKGDRMFIGEKLHCLESQITRVITKSVDDPADWVMEEAEEAKAS